MVAKNISIIAELALKCVNFTIHRRTSYYNRSMYSKISTPQEWNLDCTRKENLGAEKVT